jgi:hypothetical protein
MELVGKVLPSTAGKADLPHLMMMILRAALLIIPAKTLIAAATKFLPFQAIFVDLSRPDPSVKDDRSARGARQAIAA